MRHQTSCRSLSLLTLAIRSHFAGVAAINLGVPVFSNKALEARSALRAIPRLSLPLGPAFLPLSVATMPKPAFFRSVPVGCLLPGCLGEVLTSGTLSLALLPGELEVLAGVETFEIAKAVVGDVAVSVMDVAARRDSAESALPHLSMKLLAAPTEIPLARPQAIKAAVKILCRCVKDDRVSEPFRNDPANLHPLAVKNK